MKKEELRKEIAEIKKQIEITRQMVENDVEELKKEPVTREEIFQRRDSK